MGGKSNTGSDSLQPVLDWLKRSESQTYGLTASKVLQRAKLVEANRDSVAFRMERHTPLFEMHFPGTGMINFVTWRCTYVFDKVEKELQEKERKFVDVDIGDIDEALFSLFERIELDLESSPPVMRNHTTNYEEEVESEKELVEKVKGFLKGVDLTARLEEGDISKEEAERILEPFRQEMEARLEDLAREAWREERGKSIFNVRP